MDLADAEEDGHGHRRLGVQHLLGLLGHLDRAEHLNATAGSLYDDCKQNIPLTLFFTGILTIMYRTEKVLNVLMLLRLYMYMTLHYSIQTLEAKQK